MLGIVMSMALHLAAVLLAALSVGTTAHVLISVDTDRDGRLRSVPRRVETIARFAAISWCVVALIAAVTADSSAGNGPRVAWFVSMVAAGAMTAITWTARSWQVRFIGLGIGCLGVVAPATVGTFAQGVGHDRTGTFALMLAVALPVLCGSSVAYLLRFTGEKTPQHTEHTGVQAAIVRRHIVLSWLCLGVLTYAVVGIVAVTIRGAWADTWGILSIISLGALAVGIIATFRLRSTAHAGPNSSSHAPAYSAVLRLPVAAQIIAMLVLTVAVTIMMHVDAPSAGMQPSAQQEMVGFDVPGEWTWLQLIGNWRIDVLFGPLVVVMVVLYLLGVRRLHARGDSWPIGRTISWMAGCAGFAIIVYTGINRYAYGQLTVHMILHMGLNLFIPALLVMGGAVTLAMRALPVRHHNTRSRDSTHLPGPREWLLLLVHSRVTRLLCHPVIAITIYTVSLYGLYFSPLFDWAVRAPWGHEWMTAHFLITGYLLYWPVIGIDPGPNRLPPLGKLGMLLAVMPFHAFFGIILMSMSGTLSGPFYTELGILGAEAIADQQTVAGGLAWASGELPLLIVFISLAMQWERSDRRTASRQDRHADFYGDDELDAYNRMLQELQDQRK